MFKNDPKEQEDTHVHLLEDSPLGVVVPGLAGLGCVRKIAQQEPGRSVFRISASFPALASPR